ncbi:MAG: ATP-binding protein [Gammaproteobacteria bacterium]|nr:ATP-binding protein [Gammaproteobacteria bacterium]
MLTQRLRWAGGKPPENAVTPRRRWFFSRPRSFFELTLIGFSLVALPLIAALASGAFYVDRLSKQSREAVYRAAQAAQTSRILLEQVTTMERNARQYLVLHDPQLLKNYQERHDEYLKIGTELFELLLDNSLKQKLLVLNQLEQTIYNELRTLSVVVAPDTAATQDTDGVSDAVSTSAQNDAQGIVQELISLAETAQSILQDTSSLINSEIEILRGMSTNAKEIISWELIAVIPCAVVFIIVFAILLSRPVREIDLAIRRLGEGDFDQAVVINGPRDLEYLGQRLNWLRLRLLELEEKKSKFLAYVSHELKTPLTAIREGADLLLEGVAGKLSGPQEDVATILRKSSVNLQTMIEKLLSFNLPEATEMRSGIVRVDMGEVINSVIADHKPAIIAKGLHVTLECEKVSLKGDLEQLRVVVDNLLSNAVKYSPDRGNIQVILRVERDSLVLDVKDSGPGIDLGDRDKVFDAFYRGKRPDKGHIRGSGLGLSIAKEFVTAHSGTIVVVEEDRGAHFRVTLPTNLRKDMA